MRRHRLHLLLLVSWAGAVLLLGAVPSSGQFPGDLEQADLLKPKHIRFKASITPVDPFSDQNRADLPPKTRMEFQRGEAFTLTITGTPEKGWYTYPLTRRSPQQEGQLAKLTFQGGDAFQPIQPITETDLVWKDDKDLGSVYLYHPGPFTWTQQVYVKPSAPAGKTATLTVKLDVQVCKNVCVNEEHVLEVSVNVAAGNQLPLTEELKKRLAVEPTPPVVEPIPEQYQKSAPGKSTGEKGTSGTSSGSGDPSGSQKPSNLPPWLGTILTAIFGGLVSLLTPCVFPMIPVTVSIFLEQSEVDAQASGKRGSALLMALVYSATIVTVMTLGGMFLMTVLVEISSDYRTNLVLAGVFLVFALSLLGMYDLTLPAWLQGMTASGEGKGGMLGIFFMALTFSIISFTCVGPIYGSFITLQASSTSATDRLVQFASVFSFSAAFSAPFFLLALFPTLLRTLPRAGSWMNSVKVVMGFLELAAAVKFLRAAEIAFTGASTLFTFDLSLGLYVALALACALYLLGLYRLPHDHEAPETIGVPRLLFGLGFVTLGLYLMPGMFKGADGDGQRPRGEVFAWVESFLLPDTDPKPTGKAGPTTPGAGPVAWHAKLPDALAQAEKEKKLVFIDFTGQVCTNCKLNERNIFTRPDVQAAFGKVVLVKLYAGTPGVPRGIDQQPDAAEALRLRNEVFGSSALPLYALVRPKGEGFEIVRKDEQGLIRDVPAFIRFVTE